MMMDGYVSGEVNFTIEEWPTIIFKNEKDAQNEKAFNHAYREELVLYNFILLLHDFYSFEEEEDDDDDDDDDDDVLLSRNGWPMKTLFSAEAIVRNFQNLQRTSSRICSCEDA